MKIVIQCAAKKQPHAGFFKTDNGQRVLFVSNPDLTHNDHYICQRPDDIAEDGLIWRKKLLRYNQKGNNYLNLLPAYQLYKHNAYQSLVDKYGVENIFILSAGWGLLNAGFLTPDYDITFSSSAEKYKRRTTSDNYSDFSFLPLQDNDDLVFLGGKDYLPLFVKLSKGYHGKRVIFYNSKHCPVAEGCKLVKFQTTTRTNWHYGCAKALIDGKVTP